MKGRIFRPHEGMNHLCGTPQGRNLTHNKAMLKQFGVFHKGFDNDLRPNARGIAHGDGQQLLLGFWAVGLGAMGLPKRVQHDGQSH
jgi:hypothetical protein